MLGLFSAAPVPRILGTQRVHSFHDVGNCEIQVWTS